MKSFLLVSMLTIIAFSSNAQFNIGVKGGLNFADQLRKNDGHSKTDTKIHTELHTGLISEIKLAGNLFLQPQLLYSRKGSTHQGATGAQDIKLKMNYVELPLNIVFKKEIGILDYFIGAGPVIGYAFGGEMVQNGESKKLFSDDIKNFKREDISANITGGVQLPNGLFGSVSYQHGFTDIYKTNDVNIKNRMFTLSVGYFLPRRKK